MLSKEKINELAAKAIEAVSVKIPSVKMPEDTRWWLPEHFYQEFARLIIHEVAKASVDKADVVHGKEE